MKSRFLNILAAGAAMILAASCNDFLNLEPESSITPSAYFESEADLSAYSIYLYNYTFTYVSPGSYGISTFGYDNGTDNQAAMGYSSFWTPGQWQVGSSTSDGLGNSSQPWNFYLIRNCNYFFDQVLPKYEAGEISGSEDNIRHYIGEMYVIRAMAYFSKLTTIGDCPIIETALVDVKDTLINASKRRPQNEVARFILSDLDKAIDLLSESGPGGKNRVTKDVAYLLRSRVALYEGTWLKYHKGTAFVPGGSGWPGDSADLTSGYNIDTEISYFLTEAMASAKPVADKLYNNLVENTDTQEGMNTALTSINPYYTMFCDEDMGKETYSEVLMWRQYDVDQSVTHNIQMQLMRNGGGTGWTRGLVNSFLMENGLPIYAEGSGYDPAWENESVKATLQNRDSRIRIFTKQDGDYDSFQSTAADGVGNKADFSYTVTGTSETKMVTGYAVKKGKHYNPTYYLQHHQGVTGSIVFRGTEALLNYMEACYELNGSIDASAANYWRALRARAKVDTDFNKTIAATDMNEEAKGDWGAYSHGQLIDATLYNIRRERRNEFIGEGMRLDDLRRWRSLDQITASNPYKIEGMKYWGTAYQDAWKDSDGNSLTVVDVAGGTGNMSDQSISGDYIRPYEISSVNNLVYSQGGYVFTPAHYLDPIPQSAFRQTASGDQTDLSTSVIYQNPGWGRVAGEGPTEVN